MDKFLGYFLVALFGLFLAAVIVQDIIVTIKDSRQKSSSVTFTDISNGVYEESVLLINALDLTSYLGYIEFLSSCECRQMSYKNRSDIRPCSALEVHSSLLLKLPDGSEIRTTYPSVLILNTQSVVDGEYMSLNCTLDRPVVFSYAAFPIAWDDFVQLATNIEEAEAFYEKYFALRPQDLVTGGHKVLVTYSEKHFVDKNGVMGPSGRFIYSESSSTSGGNPLVTEMIFTYASSKYELISVLTSKSYFRIVKLLATFLLAFERAYSTYKRLAVQNA